MKAGAPSVNPSGGRGFSAVVISKAKAAAGSDGVIAYGGYLSSGEASSALTGRKKWIEYANTPIRSAPTAIAHMLRRALLAGSSWSLVENESGTDAARRGVEIVEEGLLRARLATPWQSIVAKALNGSYFSGFSLHATSLGRRADGLVVYTNIEHRPQYTIQRWLRSDPQLPFDSVEQLVDSGDTFPISLDECLYLRNDVVGDSPDGTGVLRFIVERQRQTLNYRTLEGAEMFSGMGGTPIARVPLEDINHGAPEGADAATLATYKASKVSNIETIVKDRIKTPEKRQYAVLDSATYKAEDAAGSISSVKKWDIEIVKAELAGLAEIRKIITDNDLDDARILGVEFVFVGGGDTRGTFGMHESKVSLFSAQLSADLDVMGVAATQQLARRLIAANGLDPDEATPKVIASPISTEDVEKTCRALGLLNMAGLKPNHPAKKAVFERLNLPWEDESELMLPGRWTDQRGMAGADPAAMPDAPPEAPPVVDPKPAKEPPP